MYTHAQDVYLFKSEEEYKEGMYLCQTVFVTIVMWDLLYSLLLLFFSRLVRLSATPWTPGFSVHHYLPEFAQTHVHWVDDAHPTIYRILCYPLVLLPSIFPSIRVFSSESALHIRWPKYWSFSFSISPFSEYSGLISFRIDWLDLLAEQGTLNSLLQHHSLKV